MSQYGLPYDYDEPWVCGALDLSIETLTGTAFEIRVAPTDTIMSIKTKIQRVEGIPVSQQHLLYNLIELDNSASVQDYSIQNGATLKLILSMRGGPISTRRLPPSDDVLWREVQEWMAEGRREDGIDRHLSASRMTVLVFRDGDQVNLFRVVENEDGTYSPLSDSWSGSTLRNLFAEDDPIESAKRLRENSVTMGKMQELKEKLEKLSVTKKDRRIDEEDDLAAGSMEESDIDDLPSYLRNPDPQDEPSSPTPPEMSLRSLLNPISRWPRVNEGPSGSGTTLNNSRRTSSTETDGDHIPMPRPLSFTRNFHPNLSQARKEAESIIRLQTKSLSVIVDSSTCGNLKRTPLPEIRRSPRPDRTSSEEKNQAEEERKLREKTANRMSASSFAIVEEESDMAAAPSVCSSQSSLMALPSNDDVVVAYSPISRDRVSTSLGPSRFRVSRACFVLDSHQRPKSAPSKHDPRYTKDSSSRKHILTDILQGIPNRVVTNSKLGIRDLAVVDEIQRGNGNIDKTSQMEESQQVLPSIKSSSRDVLRRPSPSSCNDSVPLIQPLPPVKKRPRCLACRKRLNITNTHTCRCGGIFCSSHRYSEAHDCHFDYKEEGKHLLRLANPMITAPKLPKI